MLPLWGALMHVEDELIGLSVGGALLPVYGWLTSHMGGKPLEVKMLNFRNKAWHSCSSHVFFSHSLLPFLH